MLSHQCVKCRKVFRKKAFLLIHRKSHDLCRSYMQVLSRLRTKYRRRNVQRDVIWKRGLLNWHQKHKNKRNAHIVTAQNFVTVVPGMHNPSPAKNQNMDSSDTPSLTSKSTSALHWHYKYNLKDVTVKLTKMEHSNSQHCFKNNSNPPTDEKKKSQEGNIKFSQKRIIIKLKRLETSSFGAKTLECVNISPMKKMDENKLEKKTIPPVTNTCNIEQITCKQPLVSLPRLNLTPDSMKKIEENKFERKTISPVSSTCNIERLSCRQPLVSLPRLNLTPESKFSHVYSTQASTQNPCQDLSVCIPKLQGHGIKNVDPISPADKSTLCKDLRVCIPKLNLNNVSSSHLKSCTNERPVPMNGVLSDGNAFSVKDEEQVLKPTLSQEILLCRQRQVCVQLPKLDVHQYMFNKNTAETAGVSMKEIKQEPTVQIKREPVVRLRRLSVGDLKCEAMIDNPANKDADISSTLTDCLTRLHLGTGNDAENACSSMETDSTECNENVNSESNQSFSHALMDDDMHGRLTETASSPQPSEDQPQTSQQPSLDQSETYRTPLHYQSHYGYRVHQLSIRLNRADIDTFYLNNPWIEGPEQQRDVTPWIQINA